MTKKNGFTIIELIITVGMMTVLFGAIMVVYLSCFKAYNAGTNRSKVRTELSQAVDLITKDLQKAQSITTCNYNSPPTLLTFNADLGSGLTTYNYILSGNTLKRTAGTATSGPMIAAGIQPPSTRVSWGTTPALFSCSNGAVTIDMTAVNNGGFKNAVTNVGETVHVNNTVMPRNMPIGLAGWWQINDGSGSTTVDSSGNSNGGTLVNTPTWAAGHIGNGWVSGQLGTGALSFSGSNDVSATNGSLLQITGPLTISAWIKWNSTPDYVAPIAGSWDDNHGNYRNYALWVYSGKVGFGISHTGSDWSGQVLGATALVPGTWYHVAGVYDGTNVYLFINGQLDGEVNYPGSVATNTQPFYIGSGYQGSRGQMEYFNGSIDDVRVYNRALTSDEIFQIYGGGLVGWWPFTDGSGSTAVDSSGQGNSGTLHGSPTWTSGSTTGSGALTFNGSSQYVSTNYVGVLSTTARTVTAWVKTTTSSLSYHGSNTKCAIVEWGSDSPSSGMCRLLTVDNYGGANNTTGLSFDQDGTAVTFTATNLYDGNWHFVAMVIPASSPASAIQMYLDGNLLTTISNAGYDGGTVSTNSGSGMTIGSGASGVDLYNGSIGDVRVYNRALSSLEIEEIYNGD